VLITVSGPGVLIETETFTSGAVGTYRVPDLAIPGTYTITFDLDGFARQTAQFTLSRAAPAATVDVRIGANLAKVSGRITNGGTTAAEGVADAVVVLTDGGTFRRETVTATSPSSAVGNYVFIDVPAGTYSIIATRSSAPAGERTTVIGDVTIVVDGPGADLARTVNLDFAP
jgi:hypothetical protein